MERPVWTLLRTFWFLLWTCLSVVSFTALASDTTEMFEKVALCDVTDKLSEGCMAPITHKRARSLVECSLFCELEFNCRGASWNTETETCFLHTPCSTDTCHSQAGSEFVHVERVVPECQHGAVRPFPTAACQCVDGWVGEECERLPYSCEELHEYGYRQRNLDVLIDINRDQSRVIAVKCAVTWGSVETFLFRANGKAQHNMTYSEFVSGYFIDERNFWIGLENIEVFNKNGHERAVIQIFFNTEIQNSFRWEYTGFELRPASEGYALRYDDLSYSQVTEGVYQDTNMTNCINGLQDVPFSAWDHESAENNCANILGAGWWFPNDCNSPCNLLGVKHNLFPGRGAEEYMRVPHINMEETTVQNQLWFNHFLFINYIP